MKSILRDKITLKRDSLTKKTIDTKSRLILTNLTNLGIFNNSKNINCYISKDSEVNTHDLIKLIIQNKGKVIVPYIDKEMDSAELSDFNKLINGKFGILEPKEKKAFNKDMLDLIIIPGVVFDKRGNRIGRGKGYYDRFLKGANAKKIALAYDLQLFENIPADSHDIKMDYIITESKIINCENCERN